MRMRLRSRRRHEAGEDTTKRRRFFNSISRLFSANRYLEKGSHDIFSANGNLEKRKLAFSQWTF
jgi:hypothetical protein